MTTTTTTFRWSPESALTAARRSTIDDEVSGWTAERIAEKMVEHDCGVWHAAHLVYLDRIADGSIVMPPCEFCGGPTKDNQGGFHSLCKLRAVNGREIPRLDSTEPCHCHPCTKARNPTSVG